MKILTINNTPLSMDTLPDDTSDDIRFAVLDNSNPLDPDFMFPPLIFMESFSAPAVVMKINGNEISMPVDWSVLSGCSDTGADLEVIPLTSLNNRGFEAFIYNPLSSFKPNYAEIEVVNFYSDVKWYFPKMKPGQLLAMPMDNLEKSDCVYFVKDIHKQYEIVDYSLLL